MKKVLNKIKNKLKMYFCVQDKSDIRRISKLASNIGFVIGWYIGGAPILIMFTYGDRYIPDQLPTSLTSAVILSTILASVTCSAALMFMVGELTHAKLEKRLKKRKRTNDE